MPYIGAGITRFNTADGLTVTGTSDLKNNVAVTGNVTTTGTVEPAGDTAAGDNAAIGFTSTEGLILTGQGSTSDITVKNDADATVFTVPTGTDDILFPDDAKILMGAGSDLQIHHSGTNSLINDVGPGNLELRTNGTDIRLVGNGGSDFMVQAISNGAVNLFHDNSQKLATTSTGVDVTGVITTDGMTTSADINFGDSNKAIFGAGNDLQIYHDGNNSVISDQGTGNLKLLATNFSMLDATNSELMMVATPDGSVDLYHNNVKKFETTSDGVTVTGDATFTNSDAGTIIARVGTNVAGIKTSSGDDFCVGTADFAQAIRIKNATGRVGIGNTAPSHLLDATVDTDSASARFGTTDSSGANNGTVLINNGGTGDAMLRFDYEGNTDRARIGVTSSGQQLEFYTGGNNERMSLDSGSLGVGIAAASASGRIHSQEANNRHAAFFHNTNASFSSSTLQVSTTRNTTNSSYNHFTCSIHGVANTMLVRDSGAILSSSNSIGSISDQRMKENIVDAASQWDDIKAVQVRKYNRIGETQKELGVIAQELEASGMGGLVNESEWFDVVANPDNEVRKSVKYSILYMKAVKALQEAMTRIETLEAKVSALENAQ